MSRPKRSPRPSAVARYSAYLDGFREFPGRPGLPEQPPQWDRIPAFLKSMQADSFDLILQLHGNGVLTNPLVALWGAKQTAGFYLADRYRPDPDLFLLYANEGLEVHRLLRLVEFLGMQIQGDHLEFPVLDADRQVLWGLAGDGSLLPGQYGCIHPGASVPERCWPVERFASVARAMAARGRRVVLTGTAPEVGLTEQIARTVPGSCLDLAGRTDLGMLAALLSDARLLICNDTGVGHLAAALRAPSAILSTATSRSADALHLALLESRLLESPSITMPRPLPPLEERMSAPESAPNRRGLFGRGS
jgi:ADP-heptose:LPS heptosyltransferase